jgi:hypothetical protein
MVWWIVDITYWFIPLAHKLHYSYDARSVGCEALAEVTYITYTPYILHIRGCLDHNVACKGKRKQAEGTLNEFALHGVEYNRNAIISPIRWTMPITDMRTSSIQLSAVQQTTLSDQRTVVTREQNQLHSFIDNPTTILTLDENEIEKALHKLLMNARGLDSACSLVGDAARTFLDALQNVSPMFIHLLQLTILDIYR